MMSPTLRSFAHGVVALMLVGIGPLSSFAGAQTAAPNAPVSFVYILNSGDTIGVETVTRGTTGINGCSRFKGNRASSGIRRSSTVRPAC